ncbi:acyl-CoA carboxylase subunit epsilon [Streptomyces sp. 8K308]|uniref:acyl-CoA carboxylase subunit epsilon n=1 Tax=Streptomyces sp. 8K308 TaxID=2530388 RepID=UPI00104FAD28|nr:acyl-CoA carboxylase subunit epsilon [Streptomyces sp. 8K308]TDC10026.1 acyl-CoA carboxylase subunit epsilon [Streptomyces sp. 8K308]
MSEVPERGPERIRVVRGNPTPEELAAAVTVMRARVAAAAASAEADAEPGPPSASAWSHPARTVPRRPPAPGPGAWRTSFWPA